MNTANPVLKKFRSKFQDIELFESNLAAVIEKQLHSIEKNVIDLIGFWDSRYPTMLDHDSYAPPILYTKGNIAYLNTTTCISIVGTRRNSSYGKTVTEEFVKGFCDSSITIISGMAQGIDSIAHKTAMSVGGKTLAVLASGLDQIQPSYSKDFADRIIDSGGGVMSAYPPGTKALNQFFVQRNRIVSGLSRATVVIESKDKGGSLWTAKFAAEQNRDVYAVPGKIYSDRSSGTHNLIKENMAIIALSYRQILDDLNIDAILAKSPQVEIYDELSSVERTILEKLEADPKIIDTVFEEVNSEINISIAELQSQLLMLEFNGRIKQSSGNAYYKVQ